MFNFEIDACYIYLSKAEAGICLITCPSISVMIAMLVLVFDFHFLFAFRQPFSCVLPVHTLSLSYCELGNYLCYLCRIGTEHEKFGFEIGTLRPMSYEQIAELLNSIAERFDWDKVMEGNNIIGLQQVDRF